MTIYTIGYGNRSIDNFLALIQQYGIDVLIDTRSIPYSRFQVHFRKQALRARLEKAGISYLYLGEVLGGKRIDPDCVVDGKVDLACLAAKTEFRAGLDQVDALAGEGRVPVLMCAELRPERCHRAWMLAPLLIDRGCEVLHIDEKGNLRTQHQVTGGEQNGPPGLFDQAAR